MPAKEPKKNRRRRKKSLYVPKGGVRGKITRAVVGAFSKQPLRRLKPPASVHPSPVELGKKTQLTIFIGKKSPLLILHSIIIFFHS